MDRGGPSRGEAAGMLKPLILLLLLLVPALAQPQPNHDIVLFEIEGSKLVRPTVVADGPEYENQPSFEPSGALLFTRMEGERTNIWRWRPDTGAERLAATEESEYSPTFIPGGEGDISTVRVEKDETQRLWRLKKDQTFQPIFQTIKPVGYHAWCGRYVALFVLGEPHELRIATLGSEESRLVDAAIGRCMQRVPGQEAVSYSVEEEGGHRLKVYDFSTGKTRELRQLPQGTEDYVWLDDGTLITSDGESILRGDAGGESWDTLECPLKLNKITRLALSPDGTKLAVVHQKD